MADEQTRIEKAKAALGGTSVPVGVYPNSYKTVVTQADSLRSIAHSLIALHELLSAWHTSESSEKP